MLKAVFIEWEDSYGCSSTWQGLENYSHDILKISSIGFIIKEDENLISISGNYAPETDNTKQQANGIITIPKKCIVSMKPISF